MINELLFKAMFASDSSKSKAMLVDLCNAVLHKSEEEPIVDITYLNPFEEKESQCDQLAGLDIKARTRKGILINIEMQVRAQSYYIERALYYWSELFTSQMDSVTCLENESSVDMLHKNIGIHFLVKPLFDGDVEAHTVHKVYQVDQCVEATDLLEIHFVQLSKVEEIRAAGERELADWITLIQGIDNPFEAEVISQLSNENKVMKMATEVYEELTGEGYRAQETRSEDRAYLDYKRDINNAKQEGETNALIMVIKNMDHNGERIEQMMNATNLSVEEVRAILDH